MTEIKSDSSNQGKLNMGRVEIYFIKDRPESVPIVAKWIWEEWSNKKRTLEEEKKRFDEKKKKDKIPLSLVAYFNGELAGTISIVDCDIKEMSHLKPWIAANYVKKEFRNKGISTKLLERAEEIAKKMGIKKIYLGTETVPDFYLRREYKKIEEVYFKGEKTVVFEKEL